MSTLLPGMGVPPGVASSASKSMSGSIVPMQETSIRRIVAGQAVNDMASAVKELIDNALDAGSTVINIRLFSQGTEILEVSDNGSGVPVNSRPFIAAKHATSKIRSFEDIYDGERSNTLGFRGEALFCLANISRNLVVTTRTASDSLGQKLEFRQDGTMNPEATREIPRKVGTAVAVVRLFDPLPVRQKDMTKQIKKHRARLMKIMQGYAVLCVGVKFNLMDMVGSGGNCREDVKLTTQAGTTTIEQTISSVLGSRFLSGLSRITTDLTLIIPGTDATVGTWKVEGLVSKSPALMAKGSPMARESQFFSINNRPVEMPRISRVLGDAWRVFAGTNTKRPACVLCFTLPNNVYDCNMSPDKREVYLVHEDAICEMIRDAATALWSFQTDGKFVAGEVQNMSQAQSTPTTESKRLVQKSDSEEKALRTAFDDVAHFEKPPEYNGTKKMARRRNAFVHDFKNARMQHEEKTRSNTQQEEERLSNTDRSTSISKDACSYNELYEASKDNAETKISNQMLGTVEALPRSSILEDPSTDRERINMTQMQITFNKVDKNERYSQDDEFDDVDDSDSKKSTDSDGECAQDDDDSIRSPSGREVGHQALIKKRVAEENTRKKRSKRPKFPIDSPEEKSSDEEDSSGPSGRTEDSDSANQVNRETMGNSSDTIQLCQSLPSKSKSAEVGLEQFVCTPPGKKSGDMNTRVTKNNNNKEMVDLDRFTFQAASTIDDEAGRTIAEANKDDKPMRDTQKDLHEDSEDSDSTASNVSIPSQLEGKASTKRHRLRSAPNDLPVVLHSQRSKQSGKSARASSEKESSDTDEPPNEEPETNQFQIPKAETRKKLVMFDAFQDTDQVIQACREARLNLHNEKDELQRMLQSRCKINNELEHTDAAEAGVHESVCVSEAQDTKPESSKGSNIVSLKKEDFSHMAIIGQFNLGFILARCRNKNLWILDQHACDEIHNYERLCETTIIHEQKLMGPMPLELTPSEEDCILENMKIFEENGFRFKYDQDKPPRHRLALTSLPHSGAPDGKKAVQYGKEDVSHLCALLGADGISYDDAGSGWGTGVDGSGIHGNNAVRRHAGEAASQLSSQKASESNANAATDVMSNKGRKLITFLPKSIAMFASRACRGSIMIGTGLSGKEMATVVERLASVDRPWKCPHGRPTLRHVRDYLEILLEDVKQAETHITATGSTLAQSDTNGEKSKESEV